MLDLYCTSQLAPGFRIATSLMITHWWGTHPAVSIVVTQFLHGAHKGIVTLIQLKMSVLDRPSLEPILVIAMPEMLGPYLTVLLKVTPGHWPSLSMRHGIWVQ